MGGSGIGALVGKGVGKEVVGTAVVGMEVVGALVGRAVVGSDVGAGVSKQRAHMYSLSKSYENGARGKGHCVPRKSGTLKTEKSLGRVSHQEHKS